MTEPVAQGLVRGSLHAPEAAARAAIVLSHGAGSDSNARLLVALSEAFAALGVAALRIDLPFRQERRSGPPHPKSAARDREAIRDAISYLAERYSIPVYAGGHSYGGRQTSMMAAENATAARALLLLSYPLHPPKKPEQLRTAHFERLTVPSLFVHGTKDPFGTIEELRAHLPRSSELLVIDGAAHELKPVVTRPASVVDAFLDYSSKVGD